MAFRSNFRVCTYRHFAGCVLNSKVRNTVHIFQVMQKSSSSRSRSNNVGGDDTNFPTEVNKKKHNANLFQTLEVPIKSPSDKKDYKVIRLQNGLTACIISDMKTIIGKIEEDEDDVQTESDNTDSYETLSDEETGEHSSLDKPEQQKSTTESEDEEDQDAKKTKVKTQEQKMAAAALCIGVGSFSDPKRIPGLAHFLEHMVFMGSEKYPNENDFDSFIKSRGGSDNASTDYETTTFYFECLEKDFLLGLDKFSQFFIAPLMKKDSIQREREAVDSEFQSALPSDTYRKEQLLMSCCDLESPAHTFAWGNLETLKDNIDDAVLYEKLHQFRERHYSAHRMTLAVQARLPLETLEKYVVQCFSSVPSNNLPGTDFSKFNEKIFDTPAFKRIYYVKPTKDMTQLELTWVLPSMLAYYKSKPQAYVSWLLGHEGKGSLLSFLKEKVWILDIFSGNTESGADHNSMYSFFSTQMVLTQEGLEHLPEVIEAVFSYIQLIKEQGLQEWIYKEIQMIEETSFKFYEEEAASDIVERLSEDMHFYPPKDYLTGSELYSEYNPEAITMVLDHLTPENMNIMVLDKQYLPDGLTHSKKERWFKTEYVDVDIPKDWMERWKQAKPLEAFSMPEPNTFITTDFSLVPEDTVHPQFPEKIIETDKLHLWYRKDQLFKLPNAYYYYYLITPVPLQDCESNCLLDLYVNLLSLQIAEEAYPAVLADLSYTLEAKDRGMVIKVEGYNQNLPKLLELICKYLVGMPKNLDPKVFVAIKDKMKKSYYNRFLKPHKLATDLRLNMLIQPHYMFLDKYHAISDITFDKMVDFSSKILQTLYIKGLVQGNVEKSTAYNTTQNFAKFLNYEGFQKNLYPLFSIVSLPKGVQQCKVRSFNKNDANSIIMNYYQIGSFTIRTSVILELLLMILDEPLFDILRTKEQLGYDVSSTLRDTYGVLGYSITVNAHAAKHTTEYVDSRIEAFIKHATGLLRNTSNADLSMIKKDLIKLKSCCDLVLDDEVSRNWGEIVTDNFMFNRPQLEIQAIKRIVMSDLRVFWKKHTGCVKEKERCSKLSVQVVGYGNGDQELPDGVPTSAVEENAGRKFASSKSTQYKLEFIEDTSGSDVRIIKNLKHFKANCKYYSMLKQ